jgi:hypothetical protein
MVGSIRVSPTRSDPTQARVILSKWASRRAGRNRQGSNEENGVSALIKKTQARQLATRGEIFERNLRLSWPHFFIGLVSLILVFSEVARSGTGVSNMADIYPSLQPEEMLAFGTSWNYSVFASTKADAYAGLTTARVWSYKFDSTSIVSRTFGRFLNVSEFPDCFFYTSECPNERFAGDVAFRMLDALVDAVASTEKDKRRLTAATPGPVALSLRSENEFIDRFHQFLLPKWFTSINWRLNQALYYSPELVAAIDAHAVCFPVNNHRIRTPRFCQELWANFRYSCSPTDSKGRSVGLLYEHAMRRLGDLQRRFPNMTVDLTFLESQEDQQICPGGFSSVGYRRTDVSTIIRARDCSGNECETVYVSDYRYETGLLVSDVVEWYRQVAALRIVGQGYYWLRGISLMLSCYFVLGGVGSQDRIPSRTRLGNACHLFMKVPKQCVVYGSPFPVLCYALAHLLDSSFMYEVFKSRYSTQGGVLNVQFRSFLSYAVVQMRNVWVYALVWQGVMTVSTSRWMTRSYRQNSGIIGVPAFFLGALSSITLAAQYRSTTFRSTRITRIMAFPSNVGRAWEAAKYQYSFSHRGSGSTSFGGVLIDLKFLVCFAIAIAAAWAVRKFLLHCWNTTCKSHKVLLSHWFILSPTPVPYSAEALWPTATMCVYWMKHFFCIEDGKRRQHPACSQPEAPRKARCLRLSRFDRVVIPFPLLVQPRRSFTEVLQMHRDQPAQPKATSLRFIQHQMNCVHGRSDDVEANVAFMNAVLMSDPLVYLYIVLGNDRSTQLGYYRSLWRPQHIVLLPVDVVGEHNEFTGGLKLLRQVNASELTWSELVQCG